MRHKYLIIAAMVAIPLLFAQPAQASRNDYCREFTKSIRVGGNLESGYGRACLQPDGSWQIVATSGTLHPQEVFPHDISRRIVYRDYYAPPRYYYAPVYYQPPGRHYGHYKHKRHDRRDWDRHDRDDDRRGRDHHRRDRD